MSDARTKRLEPDQPKRRRLLLGIVAVALVAIVAVVVAIASGGGDPGSREAGGGGGSSATGQSGRKAEAKSESKPLSKPDLIAKADAICAESQSRYRAIDDLESEMSTDVHYAEALVRIARPRIGGLRALTPPEQLAEPYGEYVAAQERVYLTDKEALAAAKRGDVEGVEAARDRRDSEDALRERLAREIGFSVCSTPQS